MHSLTNCEFASRLTDHCLKVTQEWLSLSVKTSDGSVICYHWTPRTDGPVQNRTEMCGSATATEVVTDSITATEPVTDSSTATEPVTDSNTATEPVTDRGFPHLFVYIYLTAFDLTFEQFNLTQ